MDTLRGPLPLSEADFLDFICNYFKAEYAPIRWLFTSTADAVPRQAPRWLSIGNELFPTAWRPATPQAQNDLESLNYCIRKWKLDAAFVHGIVVRYAKYQKHERLDKKLYEVGRKDLIICKALKEKHLIDALWPSPAPASLSRELLQQGVEVRRWYGDMFFKYFRSLHAVDDFTLRPEVETRIKGVGVHMLVPYAEHILAGPVEPIRRIMSNGAGFAHAPGRREVKGFGKPDQFEIRFESPGEVENTMRRSVVRQCQCLKCGTVRDVQIAVLIDPTPGGVSQQSTSTQRRPSNSNISAARHPQGPKMTQRYAPGYNMPGTHDAVPRQALSPHVEMHNASPGVRSPSPVQKKQCAACTFLNHPELTACEMCQSPLPDTIVTKPASPVLHSSIPAARSAHSHSVSLPSNSRPDEERPSLLNTVNRYSMGLGSTLFSYSPFAPPQHADHTQPMIQTQQPPIAPPTEVPRFNGPVPGEQRASPSAPAPDPARAPAVKSSATDPSRTDSPRDEQPQTPQALSSSHSSRPVSPAFKSPWDDASPDPTTPSERAHGPELTLMPLTPPASEVRRPTPLGLPANLMDEYVPASPPVIERQDEEDAGWGEVDRDELQNRDKEESNDEDNGGRKVDMIDLDAIAGEVEAWGEREED